MATTWPQLQQKRVQGSQNGNQALSAAQQQQMSQSQLTYAQKVKGQYQKQQEQQRQQQQSGSSSGHPQFRMVPTQTILQAQSQNIRIPSALPNYAYPYNYSQLQQTYHQQQQQQQQQQHQQPQSQPQSQHQQLQQQSQPPQPSSKRRGYAPRDYFDRTVSPYYNYPPASARPQQAQQQQQRYASPQSGQHYRYNNSNKRRYGQKPSYSSHSQRGNSFKNAPNMNKMTENRAKRGRPGVSPSQLKTYQTAADRDVLCWLYETHGKCRYGDKCQWLHLDRTTGKYVPTVYIMNSLSNKEKEAQNESAQTQNRSVEDAQNVNDGKGVSVDENQENNNTEELQKKFQILMEKTIQRNLEKKEKIKKESEDKEDTKQKDTETQKEKEEQTTDAKKDNKTGKPYASYGTTYDRQNVCWEFNTFVGCRKGSKCKWAHQYLAKEASHPYTGERLNGMAVRKFRLSNNI